MRVKINIRVTNLTALMTLYIALLLSACTGAHIYNPNKATLAKTSVDSFNDIVKEVNTEFDKERKNQTAALEAELENVRSLAKDDRDAALVIVATSDDKLSEVWFERMFLKRLNQIGIKPKDSKNFAEPVQQIVKILTELPSLREAVDTKRMDLRYYHYTGELTCTSSVGIAPIDEELLNKAVNDNSKKSQSSAEELKEGRDSFIKMMGDTHKDLTKSCEEWQKKASELKTHLTEKSIVVETLDDIVIARKQKDEAAFREKEVQKAFKEAEAVLKKKLPKNEKKPSELIKSEIKKLRTLLSGVSDLTTLSGELTAIQERLNNVDSLLSSMAGEEGKKPLESDDIQQRIALVMAGFPNLTDSFSELNQIINKPPLTALIMAKQELEARKRAAAAERVRIEAKIALEQEKYETITDEIRDYNKVFRLMKTAKDYAIKAGLGSDPFEQTFASLIFIKASQSNKTLYLDKTKQAVKATIVRQVHAETKSLRRSHEAEYRGIAIDYEANLALARARVDQWYAMLGPLITQQKHYHESGVKSDQVARLSVELLKFFALVGIAVGVN